MKKNILIITDYLYSGGVATFTRSFIHELLKSSVNSITVIYFYDGSKHLTFPENKKIKYFTINLNTNNSFRIKYFPKRVYLLTKILGQIKNHNFDQVYSDLTYATLAFQVSRIFYPKLHRVPLFYHIHGSFSEEIKFEDLKGQNPTLIQKIKYSFFYYLEHLTLKNCQRLSVNSQYSKKLALKLHQKLPPIEINKPGIDFSFPTSIQKISPTMAKIKLGFNPQNKILLFTSRIEPRKGVTAFFENLSPTDLPNYKFIICSHFIEHRYLYDLLEKLDECHLGSNVLLINTPSRDQLALLYRAANLTLMPSLDLETFGFSILESYYYHTPVIAFNIGANSELVPSKFLVKYSSKNTWKNFYKKIKIISSNPPIIDYSQYNFSWKKYIQSFLSST